MINLLDIIISLIGTTYCKYCGKEGASYCQDCIFYKAKQPKYSNCLVCERPCARHNLCKSCRKKTPFDDVICFGERQGSLKSLVGDYKYNSEIIARQPLAQIVSYLIKNRLNIAKGSGASIVYIPSIRRHINMRGFDHIKTLARATSKLTGLPIENCLIRQGNSVQHQLNRKERARAATKAFKLRCPAKASTVILLDDIWTTGATMIVAAKLLKSAGAKHIVGIVIVKQHSKDGN